MNKNDGLPFVAAHLDELGSLFHNLLGGGAFLGSNKRDRRTNIVRYMILKSLGGSGAHCLTDISHCVRYKKNTLSELLDRMVSDGLVLRRGNDRDRRKTDLTITAAGRAAIRNFEQAFTRVMKDYLATLPASLQEAFLSSLISLVEISMSCQKNDTRVQNKAKSR
jgi:DNA-binding MarR family transcriptional regulator